MMEWIEIIPAKDEYVSVIRQLLDLADDPSHVRTQGPGMELLVPEYLADKFTKPKPRKRAPAPTGADDVTTGGHQAIPRGAASVPVRSRRTPAPKKEKEGEQ